jgi:hypothetical protein
MTQTFGSFAVRLSKYHNFVVAYVVYLASSSIIKLQRSSMTERASSNIIALNITISILDIFFYLTPSAEHELDYAKSLVCN